MYYIYKLCILYIHVSRVLGPSIYWHWHYMYSVTAFSNRPHFLPPSIFNEKLDSHSSCKVSQSPLSFKKMHNLEWVELVSWKGPQKSLLQKLSESLLTSTPSTMRNVYATSVSVAFTKATFSPWLWINTCTFYKSWEEKRKKKRIKKKVKITYNQDITTIWVSSVFLSLRISSSGDGGKGENPFPPPRCQHTDPASADLLSR